MKKHLKAAGLGLGILAVLGIVITIFWKVPVLFLLAIVSAMGWGLGSWILAVINSRKERKAEEAAEVLRKKARGW